jgi:hypothetical protein
MVAFKVPIFGGMVPALDPRLIADTSATISKNTWLYAGTLVGLPELREIHTLQSNTTNKVFRIPKDYPNAAFLHDSTWMEFDNPDTDVVRAPVFGDQFDRYYIFSSSEPPKYNTRQRIEDGHPPFLLGIPFPTEPPEVTASGGSSEITSSRAYVVTWVSAYGEEGPPSPPKLVNGLQDDNYEIELPAVNPDNLGVDRNLAKARIYRTVTSAGGTATYFFVAEVDIEEEDYIDTLTDEVVSSREQLQSMAWSAPPTDLQGCVSMPNGIMAAWRENELWFSEPYRPHAWPAAHVLTVEYPIVGLGVTNQTLVVCTQGYPMTASGVNPANITTSKLTTLEPCISRSSIVSSPEGVYYASPNGIVLVAAGMVQNVTRLLITRDKWQEYTRNTKMRAARFGTSYYTFGSITEGVFDTEAFDNDCFAQEDYTGAYKGFLIDTTDERIAFNLMESDLPTINTQNDVWSGELFHLRDGKVYWIDQGDQTLSSQPYLWRSKIFQMMAPTNLAAAQVYFETLATTPPQSAVADNSLEQELKQDQYGLLRIFADGRHIATREIRTSGEIMTLPSGYKAVFWQFEVEARVRVISVNIASSPKELRRV